METGLRYDNSTTATTAGNTYNWLHRPPIINSETRVRERDTSPYYYYIPAEYCLHDYDVHEWVVGVDTVPNYITRDDYDGIRDAIWHALETNTNASGSVDANEEVPKKYADDPDFLGEFLDSFRIAAGGVCV